MHGATSAPITGPATTANATGACDVVSSEALGVPDPGDTPPQGFPRVPPPPADWSYLPGYNPPPGGPPRAPRPARRSRSWLWPLVAVLLVGGYALWSTGSLDRVLVHVGLNHE